MTQNPVRHNEDGCGVRRVAEGTVQNGEAARLLSMLEERLRFETLVTELSARFSALAPAAVDESIPAALQGLGVQPVLVQGYTNNSQDFTPIVLAIKKSGADILATYMTNSPDVGIFAKQLRQLGVGIPWVGSP